MHEHGNMVWGFGVSSRQPEVMRRLQRAFHQKLVQNGQPSCNEGMLSV